MIDTKDKTEISKGSAGTPGYITSFNDLINKKELVVKIRVTERYCDRRLALHFADGKVAIISSGFDGVVQKPILLNEEEIEEILIYGRKELEI